ncbi:MAG TPA: ABC transporter permease [Terriglobia bacterium]|jgi:predicted permease|nr:ABC transporter permease [Terriglobia bacterium]
MAWLKMAAGRLLAVFRRKGFDANLDEELRSHLEMLTEENIRRGIPPEEARYAALRSFGGVEQAKEIYREQRGLPAIETFLQDIRYGFRMLGKSPGFTAVVVLSLALGIGANTAIFSLIDAVVLKTLPVRQPEQLMLLNWVSKGHPYLIQGYDGSSHTDKSGRSTGTSFSYPIYEAIRARNTAFSEALGFADADQPVNVMAGGQSGLAKGEYVSGNYFSLLGVGAALGRTFVDSDDKANSAPVAVISYAYWISRFGRDPSLVGKGITVNNVPFTLIGVSAPEFFGLQAGRPTEAWIPLSTHSQVDPGWSRWLPKGESVFSARSEWWVLMMGRPRPGVTADQARASLDVIVRQEAAGVEPPPPAQRRPDTSLQPPTIDLQPASGGLDALRREFSQPLFVLMSLVGLVLLIACANVANLLLARAEWRQKEIAVRLALGAGRRRLVRQLFTESLLLALAGGAFGVILAYWASSLLLKFMSGGGDAVQLSVSPDLRVLGFTALVSIATGILFGLAPALRGTRLDLTPALKEGAGRVIGRGPRSGRMGLGLGKALVISQVAMSLLLLVGAGLFVRTLRNLEQEDIGFDRSNILLFTVDGSRVGYHGARLVSLYQEMQRRIELIPGVRSATLSRHALINDGKGGEGLLLPGYIAKPGELQEGLLSVDVHYAGPRFFETFRIPLLLGRTIGDGDVAGAPMIGVVNGAFARRYLEGSSPIGRRFGFYPAKSADMAIVGVVGDARYDEMRQAPPPTIYVPYAQHLDILEFMTFEVRTAGDPRGLTAAVRRVVQNLDRNVPIRDVITQTEQIDQATFQERLFARLSTFFALLALVLASVGLYGMMSYAVARRTNEIGIRIALGAERGRILRTVLRETITLAGLGIVIGVPAVVAASRLVASILYGLKPTDPLTITSAAAVLAAVALLAGYLPAHRASRVDPMVALRYE